MSRDPPILPLNRGLRLPRLPRRRPAIAVFAADPARWERPEASARQWRFVAEWLAELRSELGRSGVPLLVHIGPEAAAAARARADAAMLLDRACVQAPIPEAADLGLAVDPCPDRPRGGFAALSAAQASGDPAVLAPFRAWGCLPRRQMAGAHLPLDRAPLIAPPSGGTPPGRDAEAAWLAGRTGWAEVDATMRRARASGLFAPGAAEGAQAAAVHLLGLDWRRCGIALARLSVGFDPARHWLAMQDAAGLTDADPARWLPRGTDPVIAAARTRLAARRADPTFRQAARDAARRLGRTGARRRTDPRQFEMDLTWRE